MDKLISKSAYLILIILAACTTKETAFQQSINENRINLVDRYPASPSTPEKQKRVARNQQFENIGMILKDGKSYCSGTIIKHGVFLTAKHCFSGRQFGGEGLRHFSLSFITQSNPPENPFIVSSENIIRVFPDEGFNDLAYILYTPEATQAKVDLAVTTEDFLNFEENITSLMLVGFPTINSPIPQKISSEGCSLGEMAGRYRKYPKSLHYQGELFETTCPAYYGNSGGPALGVQLIAAERSLSAKIGVIGVVAHTFNNENVILKDSFGNFVNNANISPLKDAKNLNYILTLDIHNLNDAIFLGDKKKTLNTPSLYASDWMSKQKDFPSIFYPTKNFFKKKRDQNRITEKRQDYENQYSNYQSKCPIESKRVLKIFNSVVLKNSLKDYLNGGNNLKIFIDCENNGLSAGTWFGSLIISKGMINSLIKDGALTCLVSHELSHHLLSHDQITKHEISVSRKELDADSLGIALTVQSGYKKSDCMDYLELTKTLDAKVAGDDDPYPSSYERIQNLKDLIIETQNSL